MKKDFIIAGLVLIVAGLVLGSIPIFTTYQVPVEVPYQYQTVQSYQVETPEYKNYLVGTIKTMTGSVRLLPEHRIVDISIEYGLSSAKLTIWNEAGQKFTYNYVTDYDLDWQQVQVGVKTETQYQTQTLTAYSTQYESRTRVDYPFSPAGWILPLIGIIVIVYGAASKPKPTPSVGAPLVRPTWCPHCQAALPEQGDYCMRCGRKIMKE